MTERKKERTGSHLLAPVRVDDEHAEVARVRRRALAARDVPRVSHHELKVVLVLNVDGHVAVVLEELGLRTTVESNAAVNDARFLGVWSSSIVT